MVLDQTQSPDRRIGQTITVASQFMDVLQNETREAFNRCKVSTVPILKALSAEPDTLPVSPW